MMWVSVVITSLVLVTLVRSVGRMASSTSEVRAVFRAWRPWMIPAAAANLVAVAAVGVALMQVGWLSWGWWSAIGGSGNALLGQSSEPASGMAKVWLTLMSVVIPLALIVAVPRLALEEEQDFRRGGEYKTRAGRVRSAVFFGLIHMIAGIPIAFAIALIISGLCFNAAYMRAYRNWSWGRRPEHVSAALHVTYNWIALSIFAVAFVMGST